MRTVWLIAAYEFGAALRRRSFWIMTFLFPLLVLALSFGNALAGHPGDSLQDLLTGGRDAPVGLVDEAGLLEALPPDVPAAALSQFPSRAAAESALARGQVSSFYVIPADYVASGRVTLVRDDLQPLSPAEAGPLLEYVLAYALTGDADVVALVDPVSRLETTALDGSGDATGAGGMVAGLMPFIMLFILFFVITTSSSYLLQSVTREKENRTIEVLLVTVRPRQLMSGKVFGLGAVALVQIAVWVTGGLLVLWRMAGIPSLRDIGLPPSLLVWMLAFLVLGYVAYGSIVAALGTLAPSQREGNSLMFIVLLPLMVPVFFNFALVNEPHGTAALVLSLFPLSAPIAMVARMTTGEVPLWQPVVALAGLALTAYLAVIVGARVFTAGNLLSFESFSWRRARRALSGSPNDGGQAG